MSQEILLSDGRRVNRYRYMEALKKEKEQGKALEKMKKDLEETQKGLPAESYEKMKKADLTGLAEKKGLNVEGLNKADIVELLYKFDEGQEADGEDAL